MSNLNKFTGAVNHQAASVLNTLDLEDNSLAMSATNLPIGMREAQKCSEGGNTSANFGTYRDSVPGGCIVGDDNVYIYLSEADRTEFNSISSTNTDFEIEFYMQGGDVTSSNNFEVIMCTGLNTGSTNGGFRLDYYNPISSLRFYFFAGGGVYYGFNCSYDLSDSTQWYHITIIHKDNTLSFYVDWELSNSHDTSSRTSFGNTTTELGFQVGKSNYSFTRGLFGISVNDGTDSLHWKMQEGAGTTLYDSSGNGNHGTVGNYYEGFWGEQFVYSFADEEGYSDGTGNEVIPKDDSVINKDVLGNDLDYIGKCPSKASFTNSPCFVGDGVAYMTGDVLTTDTFEAYGSSSVPTCTTDGILEFADGEKYYGITHIRGSETVAFYPMCEGLYNPASHIINDTLQANSPFNLELTDGSTDNEGFQDEFHYAQLGYTYLEAVFNLITYSEECENQDMIYGSILTNVINNEILDRATADLMYEDSNKTNVTRNLTYNISSNVQEGITYTIRAYLKSYYDYGGSNGQAKRYVLFGGLGLFGANDAPCFDIENNIAYIGSGTYLQSASINDLGNGWKECMATVIAPSASSFVGISITEQVTYGTAEERAYNGDGVSGVYIGGFQIYEGSEDLPYYRTTDDIAEGSILYPALASDIAKDVRGIDIQTPQDGKSFLDTGTELQVVNTPRAVQADTDNILFDEDGVSKQLSWDVVNNFGGRSGKYFSSNADTTLNQVSLHTAPLSKRQYYTELRIRKCEEGSFGFPYTFPFILE